MNARRSRWDTRRPSMLALGVLALSGAACIIPDREIGFEAEEANPGAVRIVQPTPLAAEMLEACTAKDSEARDREQCPQVPEVGTMHSGLVERPADAPFCVCAGHDARHLEEFFVHAEDPDRRREQPADTLYGVALLDFDPFAPVSPQTFVAYEQQLAPGAPGEVVRDRNDPPSPGQNVVASTGREDNFLWRFRFGKNGGDGTDLCNDDNGRKVSVGLHTLTVMITDRPFFRPPRRGPDGEPVLDQNGDPIVDGPVPGMPDLAVGATYSMASWVFECHDPAVNPECNCEEGPP